MAIYEIIFLSALLVFLFIYFSRQTRSLKGQNTALQNSIAQLKVIQAPASEHTSSEPEHPGPASTSEKSEESEGLLREKNKKLFAMSEAVYKEKKKVDEEIEKLQVEKNKLAAEKAKVDEKVKKLWSQSTAIHKEKERINELKLVVEHKHQEVMDSVTYAKRIQEAILPDMREINASFPNSFILFKPRDIVSGDFYWYSRKEHLHLIAAVDCTGHGVPGAFMSMIGNTLLNEIVNEKDITDPGQILLRLNEEVNRALKQTQQDSQSRDGMDVAICCFDFTPQYQGDVHQNTTDNRGVKLSYAGANRPMYLLKNGELEEIKADKFPIGGLDYDVPKKFNTKVFSFEKGNTMYISTDGFADQFSPDDKKLMTRKFKETLVSIQDKNLEEQKNFLDEFIENWKGATEQTDDILVIGVRI